MYASIDKFLETQHADYWNLIQLTSFEIVPGARGLTLLLPSKSLLSDLKKLYDGKGLNDWKAESEFLTSKYHVEEDQLGPTLVAWIIKSLILTQYYPDGPSFEQGFVVNKLYKTYKLKSHTKDTVELDIGTLKKDNSFKQLKNTGPRENPQLAVWVFDGKPNILTPDFEKPEGERKKIKGGEPIKNSSHTRVIWAKVCEGKTVGQHLELAYIVSLINFLKSKGDLSYRGVISWDPLVSLYLLLQPGHPSPFISLTLIDEWVGETFFQIEIGAKEKYIALCEEASNDNLEIEAIKTKSRDLLTGERACADQILKIYSDNLAQFPGYKTLQQKVNHDILRYHYEQKEIGPSNTFVLREMMERMREVEAKFGQHSLNPTTYFTTGDDFRSYIKGQYFLYHIRLEMPRTNLMALTSPVFNINANKLADLQRKLVA